MPRVGRTKQHGEVVSIQKICLGLEEQTTWRGCKHSENMPRVGRTKQHGEVVSIQKICLGLEEQNNMERL